MDAGDDLAKDDAAVFQNLLAFYAACGCNNRGVTSLFDAAPNSAIPYYTN